MSEDMPQKFYFEREDESLTSPNGKKDYIYFSQENGDVELDLEADSQDK